MMLVDAPVRHASATVCGRGWSSCVKACQYQTIFIFLDPFQIAADAVKRGRHFSCGSALVVHLHGLVAVGGVVLCGNTNDEATPQAARHTDEHVPADS